MDIAHDRIETADDRLPPLSADEFGALARRLEAEVARRIVGQREAVRGVLVSLIAGGHALLEGVPGLGKTSLARGFAAALDLSTRRIQFTPDLMPADITGTMMLHGDGREAPVLGFQPGPVFANLVLADEINRATPKTQSALLEAMQEGTVTIANASRPLPRPFCVLATQNPIEMHGTYPLPEAQLDRFLLKLRFAAPDAGELTEILSREPELEAPLHPIADAATLRRMGRLARSLPAASNVLGYASRLVVSLHPEAAGAASSVRRHVRMGPSPRGAQALVLAGKVTALLDDRPNLGFRDIRAVATMALRHRLALSFDAEREGVAPEAIIAEALEQLPEDPR